MHEMAMMIRTQFGEGDAIRDAGLTTPDDIERFDDIAYGPDHDWQMLDVYRPKGAELPLPVFERTAEWLELYFSGKDPGFTPPLQMRGSAFQCAVWNRLLEIPYGQSVLVDRRPHCRLRWRRCARLCGG